MIKQKYLIFIGVILVGLGLLLFSSLSLSTRKLEPSVAQENSNKSKQETDFARMPDDANRIELFDQQTTPLPDSESIAKEPIPSKLSFEDLLGKLRENAQKELKLFYELSWDFMSDYAAYLKQDLEQQREHLHWLEQNEAQESPLVLGALVLLGAWSVPDEDQWKYFSYILNAQYPIEIRKGALVGLRLQSDSQLPARVTSTPISWEGFTQYSEFPPPYFAFQFLNHISGEGELFQLFKKVVLDHSLKTDEDVQLRTLALLALGTEIDNEGQVLEIIDVLFRTTENNSQILLWEAAYFLLERSKQNKTKDIYWETLSRELPHLTEDRHNFFAIMALSRMGDFELKENSLVPFEQVLATKTPLITYRLVAQRSLSRLINRIDPNSELWADALNLLYRQLEEESEQLLKEAAIIHLSECRGNAPRELLKTIARTHIDAALRLKSLKFLAKGSKEDEFWKSFLMECNDLEQNASNKLWLEQQLQEVRKE